MQLTTLIVTISGKDQPGIALQATAVLAQFDVEILDMTQAVTQGVLSLSFACKLPQKTAPDQFTTELQTRLKEFNLHLDWRFLSGEGAIPKLSAPQKDYYVVTLMACPISAKALHAVEDVLARYHLNIDVTKRLSDQDFSCIEFIASTKANTPLDLNLLKAELIQISKPLGVDVALQKEGLYRRLKRLVVFDMDSTLIQSEVIDELAREKGVFQEVASVTKRAMEGHMDYDESLRQRCALLTGLTTQDLERVYQRIELTQGAKELMSILKRLGYKTAVISGGFRFVAERIKEQLGMDFAYANQLELQNGKTTGKVLPPIINAQRKADLLEVIAQQEGIDLDQVIAIGDGANDLLMLEKAGLGIAFHAKPAVSEQAHCSITQPNLQSILYLLGFSGRDVAEAMALSIY